MGTSGPGKLTDYSGTPKGSNKTDKGGDSDQVDVCEKAIGNILLEEIEQLDYFQNNSKLPSPGHEVELSGDLVGGRLVIICDDEELGFLPTKYNYLLRCMERGYVYKGVVIDSSNSPTPCVEIDLGPSHD